MRLGQGGKFIQDLHAAMRGDQTLCGRHTLLNVGNKVITVKVGQTVDQDHLEVDQEVKSTIERCPQHTDMFPCPSCLLLFLASRLEI